MDKKTLQKLNLLIMGLAGRFEADRDYFAGLEGSFKSGNKSFPIKGVLENTDLLITFEGSTRRVTSEELAKLLCGYGERFDSVKLEYKTRGETLVVEADSKQATMKTTRMSEEREQLFEGHGETGGLSSREYRIRPGKADALLKEIGIMAENGKIRNDRIRKYNQIDYFVELLEPLVRDLASDLGKEGRPMRIVDCACGKSYLSFVLNFYIKEVMKLNCRFLGIDLLEGVIKSARSVSERLGYRNMQFIHGDIRSLLYEEEGVGVTHPDLVVSLHACDVATDFALAYGLRNRSRCIVAVPCCQSELLNQYDYEPFKDVLKQGVLKARMADVLTDGLRCMVLEAFGYTVSAIAYVSPLDTPKNLLIRAVRTGEFNKAKYQSAVNLAKSLNAYPSLLKEADKIIP